MLECFQDATLKCFVFSYAEAFFPRCCPGIPFWPVQAAAVAAAALAGKELFAGLKEFLLLLLLHWLNETTRSQDEGSRALAGELFGRCKDIAAVGILCRPRPTYGDVALPGTDSVERGTGWGGVREMELMEKK